MANIGGGYMSDGALLAWVTTQQDRLYSDLRETMASQEQRAQMASDLADLKKNLEYATRHTENFPALSAEMEAFLDEYGELPEFAELTQTVGEIKGAIDEKIAAGPLPKPGTHTAPAGGGSGGRGGAGNDPEERATVPAGPLRYQGIEEETSRGWLDALDKKLDAAGTNEQLCMISINEVKSTIDQGTQLASQLIKSSNDALTSVINNIA